MNKVNHDAASTEEVLELKSQYEAFVIENEKYQEELNKTNESSEELSSQLQSLRHDIGGLQILYYTIAY